MSPENATQADEARERAVVLRREAALRGLRGHQARHVAAQEAAAHAAAKRDEAIVEAASLGVPYAQISEIAGLTMGRISQLRKASA